MIMYISRLRGTRRKHSTTKHTSFSEVIAHFVGGVVGLLVLDMSLGDSGDRLGNWSVQIIIQ
jgi:hypothetical protein